MELGVRNGHFKRDPLGFFFFFSEQKWVALKGRMAEFGDNPQGKPWRVPSFDFTGLTMFLKTGFAPLKLVVSNGCAARYHPKRGPNPILLAHQRWQALHFVGHPHHLRPDSAGPIKWNRAKFYQIGFPNV